MVVSVLPVASAMGAACGGRATSGTSREVGERTTLIESWLHLEASAVVLVVLESLVTLLVLVLLLVVVCEWVLVLVLRAAEHRWHCPRHQRPGEIGLPPHDRERRRRPCTPPRGWADLRR